MRVSISFTSDESARAKALMDVLKSAMAPARVHAPSAKDGKFHLSITSKR